MKLNAAMWVLMTIANLTKQQFDEWFLVNFSNLLLAFVAWYVTKRHLWTTDSFTILFSIGVCMGVILHSFVDGGWFNPADNYMVMNRIWTLIFF
jgi:hypothetical protein